MEKGNHRWLRYVPEAALLLFPVFATAPAARANPRLQLTIAGTGLALLAWYFFLRWRAHKTGNTFKYEFVPVRAHYVQACLQLCIYVYWGWYWPKVYLEVPLIVSQMAFLYGFGALLSWSLGRTWRAGFGVLPIVLSTNLFLWFNDDWLIFQYMMVAVGALGKELIQWERDSRRCHIFNPSAFGLAIFSVVLILTGTSEHTWGWEIATTLGRPPYIYLQIFLLGLVVQAFFQVTLMTLGAAATLWFLNFIYTQATGVYFFVDSNIPIAVFLGLHLLMTDPATTPRASAGKLIFGSLYGLGVWVCFAVLREFNWPEYYDKLLVVPFLNLGVQTIDRIASAGVLAPLRRRVMTIAPGRMNTVGMGAWAVLFLIFLGSGYVQAPHPGASIAFWEKAAAEGRPHAVENLITKLTLLSYTGNAEACRKLARIYSDGKWTRQDLVLAAKYRDKAESVAESSGTMGARTVLPTSGELLPKMKTLLVREGKNVEVPFDLAAPLGLTANRRPWTSRQIAGTVESQPGQIHSFSMGSGASQSDLLFTLRTPAELILLHTRTDFTLVSAESVDQRSGLLAIAPAEAQGLLDGEVSFWFGVADHLLAVSSASTPVP